jgi:RNA polymerase sigma-70 factor (ECF subfamily)
VEEISAEQTAVTSVPSGAGIFDEDRGAAEAALHRRIEAALPNLRRYARSLTHDTVAADDLVQECVARALAKLHLWAARTDLRAWLFSILHNQYVTQVRRAIREGTTVEWGECASALTCAPHQIERLELRDLERAIRLLPYEQRKAVLLVGLTQGSYDAIASECAVPVGTIRSRLSRGRATLRNLMSVAPQRQRVSGGCKASAKRSRGARLSNPTYDAPL